MSGHAITTAATHTVRGARLRPHLPSAGPRTAGLSKSTLFKQFPTKAALFGAIITESWQRDAGDAVTPRETGDPRSGLSTIGRPA